MKRTSFSLNTTQASGRLTSIRRFTCWSAELSPKKFTDDGRTSFACHLHNLHLKSLYIIPVFIIFATENEKYDEIPQISHLDLMQCLLFKLSLWIFELKDWSISLYSPHSIFYYTYVVRTVFSYCSVDHIYILFSNKEIKSSKYQSQ